MQRNDDQPGRQHDEVPDSPSIDAPVVQSDARENELLENAGALARNGRDREAEKLLKIIVSHFELTRPGSTSLAEALRTRCFVRFGLARRARVHASTWMQMAIDDYARAVHIWEKGPANSALAGNLTNLGSLYYRNGRYEQALECHEKALLLAETFCDPTGSERLAAWNHLAGTLCALKRFDQAERVLSVSLSIVPADSPNRAHLLNTMAEVYEGKAAALKEAAAMGSCCAMPDTASPQTPVTAEEVKAEFDKLFARPGHGIAETRVDGDKLLVYVYDWNAVGGVPHRYRTLTMVLAAHVPVGMALVPTALSTEPLPAAKRQPRRIAGQEKQQ